jgi:hypothetical protein
VENAPTEDHAAELAVRFKPEDTAGPEERRQRRPDRGPERDLNPLHREAQNGQGQVPKNQRRNRKRTYSHHQEIQRALVSDNVSRLQKRKFFQQNGFSYGANKPSKSATPSSGPVGESANSLPGKKTAAKTGINFYQAGFIFVLFFLIGKTYRAEFGWLAEGILGLVAGRTVKGL